jgi:hypothetical protein
MTDTKPQRDFGEQGIFNIRRMKLMAQRTLRLHPEAPPEAKAKLENMIRMANVALASKPPSK